MVALLLAGVMLATGASWLTILDEIGAATLRLLDRVGGLALAPLRWLGPGVKARSKVPETPTTDAGDAAPPGESGPVADGGVLPPPPPARRRAREWLIGAGQAVFTATSAWWTTHHPVGQTRSPEPIPEPTDSTPPGEASVAEALARHRSCCQPQSRRRRRRRRPRCKPPGNQAKGLPLIRRPRCLPHRLAESLRRRRYRFPRRCRR